MADEQQPGAGLTGLGKFITFVLIAGLIAIGVWVFQKGRTPPPGPATGTVATPAGGSDTSTSPTGGDKPAAGGVEAADTKSVTTVSEYKFIPGERLPAVKGVSAYEWDDKAKILRFSYNVWAGWLPVIAANKGVKPNPDSVFAKKYGFQVELVLMDDPVLARDAFAAGKVHTLWGTADMMVLFAPELVRDSRTAPRIVQQIDWSNGGDGIVVRSNVKTVRDLKGKTVVLAKNSPSEYYLTSLLLSAGLKPADIKTMYTATAFEASAAFVADKSKAISACVSWAPDIYKIPDNISGTRVLSSTADANKLIADVYAVRADFAKDHPDIVQGLVNGIFEGMDMVKADPAGPSQWMADAFAFPVADIVNMRNDAHTTNLAENVQFFLNASNPTNFERTWKNAAIVYQKLGSINAPVPFDQVMDFGYVQKAQASGAFKTHKDESVASFTPGPMRTGPGAEAPILTQTIRINFYPNSPNPFEPARDEFGNVQTGKLYDPNVNATLEQVGRLAGQFARAVIQVEGHTDGSMKDRIPFAEVEKLSRERADAIKRALVDKFKFDPDKFVVKGMGWKAPFDAADPSNHALNRRVEIAVYPPESK